MQISTTGQALNALRSATSDLNDRVKDVAVETSRLQFQSARLKRDSSKLRAALATLAEVANPDTMPRAMSAISDMRRMLAAA